MVVSTIEPRSRFFLWGNTASKEEKTGSWGGQKTPYLLPWFVAFQVSALLNKIVFLSVSFFSLGRNLILSELMVNFILLFLNEMIMKKSLRYTNLDHT